MDLVGFYTDSYDEDGRLERNPLEFIRTRELLSTRLPPAPARVLDVGGGTGGHATWLMTAGYEVLLLDVVPAHVHAARAQGLDAHVGDARRLDFEDDAFDAMLLLGPLYHLPDRGDRAQALAEAARVTRGLVAVAAISRFAWPLYALRDDAPLDGIADTLATGRGDPIGALPDAYSHTPDELRRELEAAGLTQIEILGIEGPGWPTAADLERALAVARLCDGHPDTVASSAHLLGIARTA